MFQHRVTGKPDLARDLQRVRLGLYAVELNTTVGDIELHTVESAEKIELPP